MSDGDAQVRTDLRLINHQHQGQDAQIHTLSSALDADGNVLPLVGMRAGMLDAFGRLRVSELGQRLDLEFLYNKQSEYCDETTSNGIATWNSSSRDITLSLSDANNGSFAKIESYPVPYTPGNSHLIDITGVLDLAALGTGSAEVFLRTTVSGSPQTSTIAQSAWDRKTSGIDWSKSHIFTMDFQSLKVGTIRFGLVQNGVYVPVTQINNDNVRNTGYWQVPNQPVFWHLYTTGGITYMELGYGNDANAIGFRYKVTASDSATMKAICATVKSEGGRHLIDLPGLPHVATRGITAKTVSTTLVPLISIRPKSTFQSVENMILSLAKDVSLQVTQSVRFDVIHNGTLTGASWADVNTAESCMEYDVSATAVTGGHTLFSDYLYGAGTGANVGATSQSLLGKTPIWYRQDSVTGILTLAAIRTGGTDSSVLGAIRWEELR